MTEIEVVIKIPEDEYNIIKKCNVPMVWAKHLIKKGIPLPKGHGRLVDADALLKDVRDNSESYFADDFAHEWVNAAPTIIEADRSEEDEQRI